MKNFSDGIPNELYPEVLQLQSFPVLNNEMMLVERIKKFFFNSLLTSPDIYCGSLACQALNFTLAENFLSSHKLRIFLQLW